MTHPSPLPDRELLDEDLQILRATLATLLQDIRAISAQAAEAATVAVAQLDRIRHEVAHPRKS